MHRMQDQPVKVPSQTPNHGHDGPSYLQRVSSMLRRQLSRPVTRIDFSNPVYQNPNFKDLEEALQLGPQGGVPEQHEQQQTRSLPPRVTVHPASHRVPAQSTPPPLYLHATNRPSYVTEPPAAPIPTRWQALPDEQQPSDQDYHRKQQHDLMSPPKPGTRSGPYVGLASGIWLEVEMRSDVDDLAHCVDKYASRRYQRRLDSERAVMDEQMEQMKQQVTDQASKVTEMELMMPGKDGQYKLLRQELKDLEEDCDFYYRQFLQERKSKESAHETIAAALGHLSEIESEFARIKALIEQPSSVVAAVQAEERAKAEAALAELQRQLDEHLSKPPVVPEMVLAAEHAVGRPKKQWPDVRKILTRLAVVLLLLACIAGSILGTYYLTIEYGCQ